MKSKLQAVLDDERGVSPVIGVILMVAITVILAAVIGTFVLGLGDSLEQAPQAQLEITTGDTADDDTVAISHKGGDSIPTDDMTVSIPDSDVSIDGEVAWNADSDGFSVGNTATADITNEPDDVTIQIIHGPSESILVETTVSDP